MKISILYVLAWLLFITMLITLSYGFIEGDFWKEGSVLMSITWGKVSLIDVYVGFILFSVWIYLRENSFIKSLLWMIGIFVLGNLIASGYLIYAIHSSKFNMQKLLMGNQKI